MSGHHEPDPPPAGDFSSSDAASAKAGPAGGAVAATPEAEGWRSRRSQQRSWPPLLVAMRPHQWVKNLLLAAPLILAHQVQDVPKLLSTALGMAAFCFCASAVYLLNDLVDREADRQHPRKHRRPIASGALSVELATMAILVLGATALVMGAVVTWARHWDVWFAVWLLSYAALTTAYSFWLKRIALVDAVTLAGLYTLRVKAGGAATDIWVSPWLLAFSLLIFLGLAFLKRYVELRAIQAASGRWAQGRGYQVGDIRKVRWLGVAMSVGAAAMMGIYTQSEFVRHQKLYARPGLLLGVCPVLLAWTAWMWWSAHRLRFRDDPVLFAVRDPLSYAAAGAIVLLGVLATLGV